MYGLWDVALLDSLFFIPPKQYESFQPNYIMYLPLLIITLNLVPAQVSEFSLQLATLEPGFGTEPNQKMTIVRSFAKKEMGWVEKDAASEYQVEDVKLGVKKNLSWQGLKRIQTPQLEKTFGGIEQKVPSISPPLEIQPKPDGANFLLQRGKGKVLAGRATCKLGD